jgi:threonine dehydratase
MHVHVAAMTHTLTTPPRIIGEPAGARGAASMWTLGTTYAACADTGS